MLPLLTKQSCLYLPLKPFTRLSFVVWIVFNHFMSQSRHIRFPRHISFKNLVYTCPADFNLTSTSPYRFLCWSCELLSHPMMSTVSQIAACTRLAQIPSISYLSQILVIAIRDGSSVANSHLHCLCTSRTFSNFPIPLQICFALFKRQATLCHVAYALYYRYRFTFVFATNATC